jgi:putative transposase
LKKRFSEEQIIGFAKQVESGIPVKEMCLTKGFSDASLYTGCARFSEMNTSHAKLRKELESENAKLGSCWRSRFWMPKHSTRRRV